MRPGRRILHLDTKKLQSDFRASGLLCDEVVAVEEKLKPLIVDSLLLIKVSDRSVLRKTTSMVCPKNLHLDQIIHEHPPSFVTLDDCVELRPRCACRGTSILRPAQGDAEGQLGYMIMPMMPFSLHLVAYGKACRSRHVPIRDEGIEYPSRA